MSRSSATVYSIVAYRVRRRTHEFGLRIALGAMAADVAAAGMAAAVPGWRAARVDPAVALRDE